MYHEYREFILFIEMNGNYANIPRSKLWIPAFKRFAQMLFFAAVVVVLSANFNKSFLLTQEWAIQYTFLQKSWYLIGCFFVKTISLVTGFISMEANFIACGQGYSPASVDEKGVNTPENFNSIRQIDEIAFVTMASYDKALHNWNI